MVLSGVPRKKSPVTPPGIDPETVLLVAQRLNHCTIPGPALAYLLVSKVKGAWFMIMENVSQNEKFNLFRDYYAQELMQNQNVPIEMWNISKHRHRTNSAVEG